MTVGVVRSDRDQRYRGARRGEEPGVGVGTAVVRHLQHVGAQVNPSVDDARLGLGVEVAGQQDPDAPLDHPHQETEGVG